MGAKSLRIRSKIESQTSTETAVALAQRARDCDGHFISCCPWHGVWPRGFLSIWHRNWALTSTCLCHSADLMSWGSRWLTVLLYLTGNQARAWLLRPAGWLPGGRARPARGRPWGARSSASAPSATRKKMVKQNIGKSVSYLLYCQAALCWKHSPRKTERGKDFPAEPGGGGREPSACTGWGRWGTGSGSLRAQEGEEMLTGIPCVSTLSEG